MTRSADPATAKAGLRAQVRAARKALSEEQLEQSRAGVRAHVLARMDSDAAVGRPWRRVFAYEPLRDEPGSVRLLEAMADRGASIYVPWLRPDLDLDWMRWPDSTPWDAARWPMRPLCSSPPSPSTAPACGSAAAAGPTTGRWPG